MTKLHEVLAVEADKEGIAKKVLAESVQVFKSKHHLFTGFNKSLSMDSDDEGNASLESASKESQLIETTVGERLEYTEVALTDWLDVVLQKEATNQSSAKADLVIDGNVIASNVPATFLLGLETKLKHVRTMYEAMPTLAPGIIWEADVNAVKEGIYRSREADIKAKTQKRPMHRVLVEPTAHHRAEIEKWNEEVVVGKYTTNHQSSMLPAAAKSKIMGRIDSLIQATKQARMRANTAEVEKVNIGQALFGFIHG
jgi:hypothetical protein